jgi:hypothetical protein
MIAQDRATDRPRIETCAGPRTVHRQHRVHRLLGALLDLLVCLIHLPPSRSSPLRVALSSSFDIRILYVAISASLFKLAGVS